MKRVQNEHASSKRAKRLSYLKKNSACSPPRCLCLAPSVGQRKVYKAITMGGGGGGERRYATKSASGIFHSINPSVMQECLTCQSNPQWKLAQECVCMTFDTNPLICHEKFISGWYQTLQHFLFFEELVCWHIFNMGVMSQNKWYLQTLKIWPKLLEAGIINATKMFWDAFLDNFLVQKTCFQTFKSVMWCIILPKYEPFVWQVMVLVWLQTLTLLRKTHTIIFIYLNKQSV